ncbi:cytochrome P450 [Sphingomonas sp. CGMCC 1.13654]|uniref:Cytochrome P450 n=1 Tax=Sphingomonas chungangi TaxID=2683589 RepID=A0A838L4Y5_9SPHN|nr:cytochrome P450 [Sphingomonas chungangi]MBA2933755.1 cytochrome P450 [Sphingomonas chungangi]
MADGQMRDDFARFDHREPAHRVRAGTIWRDMQACSGLPQSDLYGGFHVVTRYDDVMKLVTSPRLFSSAQGTAFPDLDFGHRMPPEDYDPPLHGEYRSLLTRFLTRERVAGLESAVRSMVVSLLDAIGDAAAIDFVEVFARPLPVMMALELLGLPQADAARLDGLVRDLHHERGNPRGAEAAGELEAYIRGSIAAREAEGPQGEARDILSAVAFGEVHGRPLSADEKAAMIRLLMFGGFDTTAIALASTIHWLAQHPDDAARLRADPAMLELATEEMVRFASPASYLRRTVTQDTELAGCPLHAGRPVLFSFAAANRDTTKFDRADELVLDRLPNPHLGFGAGVHRCIGSFVAKLELRVALEEILARYSGIRLPDDAVLRWESGENQGISSLPLILEKSA